MGIGFFAISIPFRDFILFLRLMSFVLIVSSSIFVKSRKTSFPFKICFKIALETKSLVLSLYTNSLPSLLTSFPPSALAASLIK